MAALSTPLDVVHEPSSGGEVVVDLSVSDVRALNAALHAPDVAERAPSWRVTHPDGRHSIAVGLDAEVSVEIEGHVGYYCAGMNKSATVTVHGNAGVGVAENMMSGTVRVRGNASQSAGATAHGGLLVVEGSAAARCGISMKGVDIVVGGDVGHMSAFMGQAGRLVVCGDAGDALGDSLYEARIYVQGKNLVTLSEIDNYDPERGGPITTPIPRVVSAGINLGF